MTGKIDRALLIDLVRNEPRLWDQRNKAYHNRDIKPELWESIGEQLLVKGKYVLQYFFNAGFQITTNHYKLQLH